MMNETVARIVDIMFQDVEKNEETDAIREEVMNNCQERFSDMVASGIGEDDAIAAVVESLTGMDDVLAPYKGKVQHVRAEDDEGNEDEQDGMQHASFASYLVNKIDVRLVSEDVSIESSDDEFYHVLWNNQEKQLVRAELKNGVLCIIRAPGETVRAEHKGRNESYEIDGMSDFVKNEDGKIEITMDSIGRSMKQLGDKIKLMFSEGVKINIGRADCEVTIQIPENVIPHVKVLTTSGDIHVEDVALTDLSITSTSGDINISLDEDQHLKLVELRTISGDIEATAFTHEMTIVSTSGDVEVEGYYHNLTVNTISGDIDVRADVKNMTFKAVSGDVDLAFDSNEIRDVRGSTISGDIDIDLPDGIGEITINTQTRSGDVTTCYHASGVGPAVTGGVSTMSGDIMIR